ncbi:uncharacterized protein LOC127771639 [Oryza glaberrima]|uniref:uncharacterized protein LOC127771639 n=1 Tax=Oryza glaberrima TaxID=4538 RepID=UPI00224BECE2|nr:uncharacterized protein LOC127771639 [Oryza glaberrima]
MKTAVATTTSRLRCSARRTLLHGASDSSLILAPSPAKHLGSCLNSSVMGWFISHPPNSSTGPLIYSNCRSIGSGWVTSLMLSEASLLYGAGDMENGGGIDTDVAADEQLILPYLNSLSPERSVNPFVLNF